MNEETPNMGGGFNWNFLGDVAQAIPQVTAQFNRGFQQNQLAIANANARAAEANAGAFLRPQRSNMGIWIGAGILVVVLILVFTMKKA